MQEHNHTAETLQTLACVRTNLIKQVKNERIIVHSAAQESVLI